MVKKKIVILAVKSYEWKEDEGEEFGEFVGRIRKRVSKKLKTQDILLKVVT